MSYVNSSYTYSNTSHLRVSLKSFVMIYLAQTTLNTMKFFCRMIGRVKFSTLIASSGQFKFFSGLWRCPPDIGGPLHSTYWRTLPLFAPVRHSPADSIIERRRPSQSQSLAITVRNTAYFPKRFNPSVSRVENFSLCSAKRYVCRGPGVQPPVGSRGSAKGGPTHFQLRGLGARPRELKKFQ